MDKLTTINARIITALASNSTPVATVTSAKRHHRRGKYMAGERLDDANVEQ